MKPELARRVLRLEASGTMEAKRRAEELRRAGAELIKVLTVIQGHSITHPCSISQRAALAALNGDQRVIAAMVAEYRRRRDFVVEALSRIPGVRCHPPEGAFYAFPDVSGLEGDSQALADRLLREAHVAVVPGGAFGCEGEGHIRISFAASMESLKEALRWIEAALREPKDRAR